MRSHPPILLFACAVLWIAPLSFAGAAADQSPGEERVFHHSKAEVEKAIQELHATLKGRLPILDGFADQADEQSDRFTRGYYECAVQVVTNGQDETKVHVTAKITAWYTDPNPSQSGYRVLRSNGHVETDLLDRIDEALAIKEIVTGAPPSPGSLALRPEASGEDHPAADSRPQVTRIRTSHDDAHTRIIIDVGAQVKYQAARLSDPDRIYLDIENTKIDPGLLYKGVKVEGEGLLKRVRVGQNQPGVARVVLEVDHAKDYSVSLLPNPYRLVVDVYRTSAAAEQAARTNASAPGPTKDFPPAKPLQPVALSASEAPARTPEKTPSNPPTTIGNSTLARAGLSASSSGLIGSPAATIRTPPSSSEDIESLRHRREQAERDLDELNGVVENLEEILRNQTHPSDIAVVRKSGTRVMSKPSANGPMLFSADGEDEFQVLDSEADWIHVQISGASRGWIRRSDLNLPEGLSAISNQAGVVAPAAEQTFQVIREETNTFKGTWEPLTGKSVKIIWTGPASAPGIPASALAKRNFAKSLFIKAYREISSKEQTAAGVVIVFDSADGGQVAATLENLKQWQTGNLPEASFWRLCSVDPPELFDR
jgi:hypothetical protein